MKNLIIIGARGFGRDIYNLAIECQGYQKDYQIKGFLDIQKDALDGFPNYPPILDSVEDYIVEDNDVFICAMGDVQSKKYCIQIILDKGGKFISLIHPTADVNPNAKIGNGCIVLNNTFVGAASIIGDFVLIQVSTVIGHDVKIGNYSRVDCHVVCIGGIILEDEVTIHTSAVINHKVVVGKGAHVGAGSFVIRKVEKNTTVYGNPARKL
jgi:sugar O-acyltransferase (sialic acid O-acetyltransferase NeuD family)